MACRRMLSGWDLNCRNEVRFVIRQSQAGAKPGSGGFVLTEQSQGVAC